MTYSREEILQIMKNEKYPLSSKYDPDWILSNSMGSHTLWLQEALAQSMNLKPNMRVLDMGCGKAISSIFLAKEFGVKVWAADLKNDATDNWNRICEAGVSDTVCPIRADAHDLPFAEGYFDAMCSVNSLFFYVTGGDFLRDHLLKYIKPGGEIGIVVPSFVNDYTNGFPEAYQQYVQPFRLDGWRSSDWWKEQFEQSGLIDVLIADTFDNDEGKELFHKSAFIFNAHEEPFNLIAWEDLTFTRIIARRKES